MFPGPQWCILEYYIPKLNFQKQMQDIQITFIFGGYDPTWVVGESEDLKVVKQWEFCNSNIRKLK